MKIVNVILVTITAILVVTGIVLAIVFTVKNEDETPTTTSTITSTALESTSIITSTPETASFVDDTAFVTLPQGKLQGLDYEDHFVFYGIPYAKPPVGDLRWKNPEDPEAWDGVLNATRHNVGCMQDPEHPTGPEILSEDCLFLNIFMPDVKDVETQVPRPVLFWIHGGSWIHGYGSSPIYNGRHFVKEESVIVVTINYSQLAIKLLTFTGFVKICYKIEK